MAIIKVVGSISEEISILNPGNQASYSDANIAKEGMAWSANSNHTHRIDFPAMTELWFSVRVAHLTALNQTGGIVAFFSTAFSVTQPLFRLYRISAAAGWGEGNVIGQYWNGSVWTSVGTGPLTVGSLEEETFHIKMDNSTGIFQRYRNTVLDGQLSGDTILTAATTIDRVELYGEASSGAFAFSEAIVADEDTRGWRLNRIEPTGNGANTAWTGVFSDVDEISITDGDYIWSPSANQIETYTCADIYSGLAGLPVKAVIVSVRARKGGTGPQNLQGAVRLSGVDYFSANLPTLNTAFQGGIQAIWAVNPATGLAWTQAEVNGAEIGVKSIA